MKAFFFFLILSTLAIQSASAYDGIFAILNETYTENASGIPAPNNTNQPSTIQKDGHIEGWINITGFRGAIIENNATYVQGNPADYAIVEYGVWGSFPAGQKCESCTVTYIKKNVKVTTSGDYVIATIYLEMLWRETFCDRNSCWDVYTTEFAAFSDSELSPLQYPALKEPVVIITQHNNSMYENVGIIIFNDNYSKITFDYYGNHAERKLKLLHAENGLGNVSNVDIWEINGTGISRFYNEILLDGNLSKMDINKFDIRAYNAFTSVKANPAYFIVQRDEFDLGKSFTPMFFGFVGVIGVLSYSTLFLLRRLSRWKLNLF